MSTEHVGMSCDYITQASLKLMILSPQLPECWEYRGVPSRLARLKPGYWQQTTQVTCTQVISVASVKVTGHQECKHGTHASGQILQQACDTRHGSKHVTMETWEVTTVRQCP